eukprot:747942-Hanusia_phi.AAC.4
MPLLEVYGLPPVDGARCPVGERKESGKTSTRRRGHLIPINRENEGAEQDAAQQPPGGRHEPVRTGGATSVRLTRRTQPSTWRLACRVVR